MSRSSFASLDELLAQARHESAQLKNYYVGVEHLLLALLRVESGIAAHLLAQQNSSSNYIEFVVQSYKGSEASGYLGLLTPRASRVFAKARSYIQQGVQPDERALLRALLEERDSLIISRVLSSLGVAREQLLEALNEWRPSAAGMTLPLPQVLSNDPRYVPLPEELAILQQIFRTCTRVTIERALSSEGNSYSGARVLLVRAYDAQGRSLAPSVVKLHEQRAIWWEKMRYNEHVRDKLPANTSYLVVDALPEDSPIGGLKYSYVQGALDARTTSLKDFVRSQPAQAVARFLREQLYDAFRHTWWDQRTPYKFTVWQEYDLLLPPALELEALPEAPSDAHRLQPMHQALRARGAFHADDLVVLDNFTVLKVKPAQNNTVQLVAGAGAEAINLASRVTVRNFNHAAHPTLYRGVVLERVAGRVLRTRDDILQERVLALAPDFDFISDPLPPHASYPERLPNPLYHYHALLETPVDGTFCPMHGDLHVGNVLIGRNNEAWLIDFEWARDGHTLFDWATLEISLLFELLAPYLADSWDSVWQAIARLDRLNCACVAASDVLSDDPFSADPPYNSALAPIMELRRIAAGLLRANHWAEYFIPLALMALRALSWQERPLTVRRLAYLIAALAIHTIHKMPGRSQSSATELTETG
ncbi:MAG: Clp protease N-terminal domain-containing protein [Anaerolineae bacterium]|nr:hypothetical protein [Anaerolineae bacterium]MDW8299106.1 Clp protease N-terminal domain-containing protein [Anaerolineae bacterium]